MLVTTASQRLLRSRLSTSPFAQISAPNTREHRNFLHQDRLSQLWESFSLSDRHAEQQLCNATCANQKVPKGTHRFAQILACSTYITKSSSHWLRATKQRGIPQPLPAAAVFRKSACASNAPRSACHTPGLGIRIQVLFVCGFQGISDLGTRPYSQKHLS